MFTWMQWICSEPWYVCLILEVWPGGWEAPSCWSDDLSLTRRGHGLGVCHVLILPALSSLLLPAHVPRLSSSRAPAPSRAELSRQSQRESVGRQDILASTQSQTLLMWSWHDNTASRDRVKVNNEHVIKSAVRCLAECWLASSSSSSSAWRTSAQRSVSSRI